MVVVIRNTQWNIGPVFWDMHCSRKNSLTAFFESNCVNCMWILHTQLLQAADWFYTAFIHIASYGDGFIEAPDAELIEPKVEPLSEKIKYLLFNLNILEADVHLLEGDSITRIQVGLIPTPVPYFCDSFQSIQSLVFSSKFHYQSFLLIPNHAPSP